MTTQIPFEFETQLHYWVNRASFLMRKEIQERFSAEGLDLRAEEMAILIQLWRQPGQTPTRLADSTVRDRTTVTRLLDGMVRKNLVSRGADTRDRRRVIVRPTGHSMSLQPVIIRVARGMIAESMQGISPGDADTALRVLEALTENLLKMRADP